MKYMIVASLSLDPLTVRNSLVVRYASRPGNGPGNTKMSHLKVESAETQRLDGETSTGRRSIEDASKWL